MPSLFRPFSVVIALQLLPPASFAQIAARDTARIAPLVVTATRSPLAATQVPASTTSLSGEMLRRQGITTVVDALRQVPGVAVVQTGSYGGATSLFIRGGESKFTKVLIDGIPVNDAGGAFDFSTLSTDNLDRIEIVRGPASVLYGSDAVAGVVQIFTRRGAGEPHADASIRGGGFGTADADVSLRGALPRIEYSFGGARHRTDGIQAFNSGFQQTVASARVGTSDALTDAAITMRYTDEQLHYPTDGSGQVVDSNAARRAGRLSAGFDGGLHLPHGMALRLALAAHETHAATEDQADSPGDIEGYYFSTGERTRRRSADLRLEAPLPYGVRVTIGEQLESQWLDSQTESNFGPNAFTARRQTHGTYAQLLASQGDAYTATVGIRNEHNEQFGTHSTGRAAASARVAATTRVRASIGSAFREPTFIESYGGPFATGNPSLSPEQSTSMDAGVEQEFGRVHASATWFRNDFKNLIDYRFAATGPHFFNVARTRTAGAELEARTQLTSALSADGSFTYLATRVVDPGLSTSKTAAFLPGAHLLRRPMHTIDAGVTYRDAIGVLDVRAHRVGVREDNYYAPDFSSSHVTLPAYTRVDVSGELPLGTLHRSARAVLTGRVDNVFDANYSDIAGINYDFSRTDEASVRATGYRGAGRRVLVGVRIGY